MQRITKYILTLILLTQSMSAKPIMVDSLEALMPYLSQDDVHVVMKPGTYWIRGEDAKAGKFGSKTFQSWVKTLLPFSGSNSIYDFTGVTLKVETSVGQSIGSYDCYKIQTTGNNIVIRNLTVEDIGSVHDAPTRGNLGVCMDGSNNLIEGLHLSTKGSYPYGYGEAFGKGGPSVISGIKKHSAVLIRGLSNHFKDCTVIHRGYGHAIFMQAANLPVIEGCYVEGEMVKTNDILAEKGTGTLGDLVNFMTYFGYPIPPNYSMCTGEEGIRAYNGGQTWINGEIIERETQNPTILDCKIVNMRGGVTLTHASGRKYVKGTTAIGCSRGFCIGSGDIIDCYADTSRGPALGIDYERDSGMNAEITLLPNEGEVVNGQNRVAYIAGRNHNITIKSTYPIADQSMHIQIGGDKVNIGSLSSTENYSARNITINNQTTVPIVLAERVEESNVVSNGFVTDLGKNNSVRHEPRLVHEATISSGQVKIDVPANGTYFIEYNIRSGAKGIMNVSNGSQVLDSIESQAGDRSVRSHAPIPLSKGKHTLQISHSAQTFALGSIKLFLEYPETPVEPYVEVINGIGQSQEQESLSELTLFPGHTLSFDPQPSLSGAWRWINPKGLVSKERKLVLPNVSSAQSGTYHAGYKNVAGYITSQAIDINVTNLIQATSLGGGKYTINVPYPAIYFIGYDVPTVGAGRFSVEIDGTLDEVEYDSSSEPENRSMVSSKKPFYLKKGSIQLELKNISENLELKGIKLLATTHVSAPELPVVSRQNFDILNREAFDISDLPEVDLHIVCKGLMQVSYQIDNEPSVGMTGMKSREGTLALVARRLSGNTLRILLPASAHNNIQGVYLKKSVDPFDLIEAENYSATKDTRQEKTQDEGGGNNVGSIDNGDWLKYENIELTGATSITARVANIYDGGSFEIRIGSLDGPGVGSVTIPKTGGWQNWKTVSSQIREVVGIHDVYLIFKAPSRNAGNINWFKFSPE